MRLYLSGGMEAKADLGGGWRKDFTEQVEPLGYTTFDPVVVEQGDAEARDFCWVSEKTKPDLSVYREMVRRKMFIKDMEGLQHCDAVVLLYDESVRLGAGTLAEAWEAFREGKPLYVLTEYPQAQVPGWLIGESTALFSSFSELLNYLANPEQVKRDIKEAEMIRDHYLGEVSYRR